MIPRDRRAPGKRFAARASASTSGKRDFVVFTRFSSVIGG